MPSFGPISRRELIQYLHTLGFEGPFAGGKHQFMLRPPVRLVLPNPHGGSIGRNLPGPNCDSTRSLTGALLAASLNLYEAIPASSHQK